jgi:hypothetical protein
LYAAGEDEVGQVAALAQVRGDGVRDRKRVVGVEQQDQRVFHVPRLEVRRNAHQQAVGDVGLRDQVLDARVGQRHRLRSRACRGEQHRASGRSDRSVHRPEGSARWDDLSTSRSATPELIETELASHRR